MKNLSEREQVIVIVSRLTILLALFFIVIASVFVSAMVSARFGRNKNNSLSKISASLSLATPATSERASIPEDKSWKAPDESTIPLGKAGREILYGKELIVHTAKYLGPKGSVAQIANLMNCQNCHNEAGTKAFALNFSAVKSTYPQFKARSNSFVSIAERINGCFQRSLNGTELAATSKEMLAIIAYMKWLGKEVDKGVKPKNAGIMKLAFLDRAADPLKGKVVYTNACASCHRENGAGVLAASAATYIYPPLWGKDSYNDGAGLVKISNFAGFVKNNMPFGANYRHPVLSDEQAWDVAAFVNSQPRPHKDQKADWKNLSKKPIDFPFGPYVDNFSEKQHKYGPFNEIAKAHLKQQ
ncbi:MAG: c-type cytochrome [Bacteroidota bacterium]